jgi:hypothetical protein
VSAFREAPVPSADAVRSIRIAHTLIERYLVLARMQPQSSAAMELQIGEAQQIYPEIWRHLDVARRALVADGRDVTQFDAYRKSELIELGVTDIDFSRELDIAALMLGRIRERTVKSATFNVGGAQRAASAMGALMARMPEVDFAALERAEEKEIAAAGSLHAGKWVGIAKWLVAAAAVIGVAVLIHRIATAPSDAPPPAARPRAEAPPPPPDPVQERIDSLRGRYEMTCDPAVKQQLLAALRDAHQTGTAQIIEKERCTPPHPTCDDVRAAIAQRVGTDDLACEGVLAPAPALFVLAGGKRVLLDPGATHELVANAPAPLPMFVGLGDFDGDGAEEVVTADDTHLMVTQLRDGAFVDVPGPTLKAGCSATPRVEGDFRNGNTGKRAMLVIAVDDPQPKKGCPTTGRHTYSFAGGSLVED